MLFQDCIYFYIKSKYKNYNQKHNYWSFKRMYNLKCSFCFNWRFFSVPVQWKEAAFLPRHHTSLPSLERTNEACTFLSTCPFWKKTSYTCRDWLHEIMDNPEFLMNPEILLAVCFRIASASQFSWPFAVVFVTEWMVAASSGI